MTITFKDAAIVILVAIAILLGVALIQANLALSASQGQCMTAREAETVVRTDERIFQINELCLRTRQTADQSLATDVLGSDAFPEEIGHGEIRNLVTGSGPGVPGPHVAARR